MARDYSNYSIPELQEALSTVDGKRYPENEAALKKELQARRDSGEYDRLVEEALEDWRRKELRGLRYARWIRKAVLAASLVLAPLYAFTDSEVIAASQSTLAVLPAIFIAFVIASIAAGVGLLLDRAWGHWLAAIVLGLQAFKVQVAGFVFSLLSVGGVYVYVADGPRVGVAALLDPGLALGTGPALPLWIGVNIVAILLLVYLFVRPEDAP